MSREEVKGGVSAREGVLPPHSEGRAPSAGGKLGWASMSPGSALSTPEIVAPLGYPIRISCPFGAWCACVRGASLWGGGRVQDVLAPPASGSQCFLLPVLMVTCPSSVNRAGTEDLKCVTPGEFRKRTG